MNVGSGLSGDVLNYIVLTANKVRLVPRGEIMKVEVDIPNGDYCRVWGKIHCIFNQDTAPGKGAGICRYVQGLCEKDDKGQCKKHELCPNK